MAEAPKKKALLDLFISNRRTHYKRKGCAPMMSKKSDKFVDGQHTSHTPALDPPL